MDFSIGGFVYNDFMKLGVKSVLISAVILMLSACGNRRGNFTSLPLASFTENDVKVSIHLDSHSNGEYFLSATFTPLDGYHMYSKDIPLTGVDGLGRPTLLELTSDSQMLPLGGLMESVQAEEPNFEPKELLVYPPGAVTLSLLVKLPPGNEWVEDVVSITYMSCSDHGCKAPVVGKPVSVRIPGADALVDHQGKQ